MNGCTNILGVCTHYLSHLGMPSVATRLSKLDASTCKSGKEQEQHMSGMYTPCSTGMAALLNYQHVTQKEGQVGW